MSNCEEVRKSKGAEKWMLGREECVPGKTIHDNKMAYILKANKLHIAPFYGRFLLHKVRRGHSKFVVTLLAVCVLNSNAFV